MSPPGHPGHPGHPGQHLFVGILETNLRQLIVGNFFPNPKKSQKGPCGRLSTEVYAVVPLTYAVVASRRSHIYIYIYIYLYFYFYVYLFTKSQQKQIQIPKIQKFRNSIVWAEPLYPPSFFIRELLYPFQLYGLDCTKV